MRPAPSRPKAADPILSEVERTLHVLLVEDNAGDARRVREQLAQAPFGRFELTHANRLERALDLLKRLDVDIILTELKLPDGKELEVVDRLQAQRPELPIVILTGTYDEFEVAPLALRQGVQDFLVKGEIEKGRLARTLRYAVERQLLRWELGELSADLKTEQENLQLLFEQNADGMALVDEFGILRLINPAAAALLGRRPEAMVGLPFELPLDTKKTTEVSLKTPHGLRIAEMRAVQTRWRGGKGWEAVHLVSLRDITERKRLESLKERFIATVSHELRTPLTSIKEGVSLMLDEALGTINPGQRDFLATVDGDIDRLAGLIDNLLDLSKIEAGRIQLVRGRVNVLELIASACRTHQPTLGKRRVECPRPSAVPPVFADPDRILQVLGNLISNAIKFTKEDGRITLGVAPCNGFVSVSVQDDGPGISKQDRAELFQRFYQVGKGNGRTKGTGLGLSVCKELVEMHKGKIWVESEPGKGATFVFTLPVYSQRLALEEGFEEIRALAQRLKASQIGLIALNADPADDLEKLADTLRKHVHQNDLVVALHPNWIAVLAVAGPEGVQAIRQRLPAVLKEIRGSTNPALSSSKGLLPTQEVGVAFYPNDGTEAMALFARATGG